MCLLDQVSNSLGTDGLAHIGLHVYLLVGDGGGRVIATILIILTGLGGRKNGAALKKSTLFPKEGSRGTHGYKGQVSICKVCRCSSGTIAFVSFSTNSLFQVMQP